MTKAPSRSAKTHAVSELPLRHRDRGRLERGEIRFAAIAGRVFAHPPRATDARQGLIGDCYFLSALSALARSAPEKLQSIFEENEDGTLTATFHRRTASALVPERVTIDRLVPVRTKSGTPLYARSDAPLELWPLLAEKAYAAWKGGYHVMGEGGLVEQTLEELTGERTRMLFVAETHPARLWSLLSRATKEGWPAAVCTYGRKERPAIDELGFHPNHILVFLGVHTWMGRRIVWLRDPFDTPAAGTLVKPDPQGVYTLAWEDFLEYFAEVELNGAAAEAIELPPYPSRSLAEVLDHSYVFHSLKAAQRRLLAKNFRTVEVDAGHVIASAGGRADYFYIVAHGSAAIEIPVSSTRVERAAVLHAGDQSGEMHVLAERRLDATLRAITRVKLFRLDAGRLRHWLKKFPELGERFQRRWDLQLTMLEWKKHQVTTVDADSLLRSGELLKKPRGAVLYRPGDISSGIYVVVEGTVHLQAQKNRSVVRAGQVFGESEVLNRSPRTSLAKVASRVTLVRIDLGASAEVMEHFDVVQRQLAAIAERREHLRTGKRRHG